MASRLEMQAMIHFLWAKRCNYCEIYWQLHEVYDENAKSRQAIVKWLDMFENACMAIDNAECKGKPSTATNSEITTFVSKCIHANSCIAIYEIFNELDISHEMCIKLLLISLYSWSLCSMSVLSNDVGT